MDGLSASKEDYHAFYWQTASDQVLVPTSQANGTGSRQQQAYPASNRNCCAEWPGSRLFEKGLSSIPAGTRAWTRNLRSQTRPTTSALLAGLSASIKDHSNSQQINDRRAGILLTNQARGSGFRSRQQPAHIENPLCPSKILAVFKALTRASTRRSPLAALAPFAGHAGVRRVLRYMVQRVPGTRSEN